ncbi:hypothetical protein [Streptomyces sp. ODS05-4]|uniref:DUF7224 domain-containing protein n=1 Tax=Streptomyces sp. ODS05-4 TaxID=2944939 RepID=UPI00210A2458|nr:hypothetical protein [Streptomyces sp. ODS05-4]
MITWANLRASAAIWLLIPSMFYIGLYIGDATYSAPSGYGIESGELAAFAVVVIAPAVAGAAAWEAGRHRQIAALQSTSSRGMLAVRFRAALPAALLGLALAVGALVLARRAVGAWPANAGWLAVAHLFVLPLGWLIVGWCLGTIMPRSVAAPIAAIGCWAWLSMPHAIANPWLRHLGGFVDGTSSLTDVRTAAVYTTPWLVVAGLAIATSTAVGAQRRGPGLIIATLVAVTTLASGRALTVDWGYRPPTHPRDVALTCEGAQPRVCVPPEYLPYTEQLRKDALKPLERLRAAGIPAPEELRIDSPERRLTPGAWPLYWALPPTGSGTEQVRYAADLAESAVTGVATLQGIEDCRTPGSFAAAWATLVVGVPEQTVRQGMSSPDWQRLTGIRQLPKSEQANWFQKTVASQKHCIQATS